MLNQENLKTVVFGMWLLMFFLVVLKCTKKWGGRSVAGKIMSIGVFSAVTVPVINSIAPAHAQTIETDPWIDVETSSSDLSTSTTYIAPEVIQPEQKYVVKSGDNLWSIAKVQSAPGEDFVQLWNEIISLNSNNLQSKDPNLIFTGEELVVPKQ